VLVALRLGRFAPLRRHVLEALPGERISSAERGHSRNEQPDYDTAARSRQPLLTRSTRVGAATESGNAGSIYASFRGANGLGPPFGDLKRKTSARPAVGRFHKCVDSDP